MPWPGPDPCTLLDCRVSCCLGSWQLPRKVALTSALGTRLGGKPAYRLRLLLPRSRWLSRCAPLSSATPNPTPSPPSSCKGGENTEVVDGRGFRVIHQVYFSLGRGLGSKHKEPRDRPGSRFRFVGACMPLHGLTAPALEGRIDLFQAERSGRAQHHAFAQHRGKLERSPAIRAACTA
jgi:hypothetical protein